MKKLSVTFLLVILVFSSSLVAADAVKTIQMDRPTGIPSFLGYVPDRFIVVLKDDGPLADAKATEANAFRGIAGFDELTQEFAVSRIKRQFDEVNSRMAASIEGQRLARYFKVSFASGSLDEAMAGFASHPLVESVEPIGIHALHATPNDTYYDDPPPTYPYDQWHYWDTYGVDADLAWDTEAGDPGVLVGVLDIGVKYDHGDLGGNNPPGPDDNSTTGNIWVNGQEIPGNSVDDDGNGYVDDVIGWDFVERTDWYVYECTDLDCGGADNDPWDGNGHGTHVAGTIAGITNNGYAVAGVAGGYGDGTFSGTVANGVKVVPCRIGYQLRYLNQDVGVVIMDYVAEAMYYMAELKIRGDNVAAVNCSFGTSNTGGLGAAVDYLLAQDVMVIVSSGNDGTTSADYLGTRADCMDVGATNQAGDVANFSNYGSWVDIAAPGEGVLSTTTDPSDPSGDYISVYDGTSMACPHVVAVAALLESADPTLTAQDKWDILVATTTPYNGTRYVGTGIVNARNALDAVQPCDVAADFTADLPTGCAPLTIQFSDLSTGPVTSWDWDFGDGGTSQAQNPAYEYLDPGVYTVTLTVTSSICSDTETKVDFVTVSESPVADFSGAPTTGDAPLTVDFTDLSTGNPTVWSWDFGDGGFSAEQDPTYTYNDTGHFTVSLTASSACGDDTQTKVDYIVVTEEVGPSKAYAASDVPVAGTVTGNYANTHTSDDAYEVITEIASVSHPVKTTSYLEHKWIFNVYDGSDITFYVEGYRPDNADGDDFIFAYSTDDATYTNLVTIASATEQTYSAAMPDGLNGTVYIRVLDDNRSWGNSSNDPVYIDYMYIEYTSAPAPPVADFSGAPTSGAPPLLVNFTDLSSGNPTSWSWDFGDGIGTSDEQHPTYTYNNLGTYTVSLTATNAYGSDTETKIEYITVTDEGPGQMHVHNMVVDRRKVGPNYVGTCTVTIRDDLNQAVVGATVYVTATGPTGGDYSGVTGSDGTVSFETAGMKKPSGEWCFEVTNVTHATLTYDPAANDVTLACESGWVYGNGDQMALVQGSLPSEFGLEQNYPNPFNPATEISFRLPEAGYVSLEVFNITGQRVTTLVNGITEAGEYTVTWDGTSYSSGIYLYRLQVGNYVETQKMVLLK